MTKHNEVQKTENKTAELTKPNDAFIATLASEFVGAVEVRSTLLKVPTLRLTQAMSDAAADELAKIGDFACTERKKNYGKTVTIIPLVISESASLLYSKNNPPSNMMREASDGDVLCRSNDLIKNMDGVMCKNCPYGEYYADWGNDVTKKTPKCKTSIDIVCLVDGEDDMKPVFFSLRKSSFKAGKALVNLVINDPLGIPFGAKYTLQSEDKTFDNYKYKIVSEAIKVAPLTADQIKKIIPVAKKVLEAKKSKELHIDSDQNDNDIPV